MFRQKRLKLAWARCYHYETESTISGLDVVLIPGLFLIFHHGCEIKSGWDLGMRLKIALVLLAFSINPQLIGNQSKVRLRTGRSVNLVSF